MKKFFQLYESPVGPITIAANKKAITHIFYGKSAETMIEETEDNPMIKEAVSQLEEYFAGKRKSFDLPLEPAGTEFQKAAWKALCDIPYGETRSYRQIAEAINCPKGYRAVGLANNRNPIAIVVPCHRVIGANGGLTGYAGGILIKAFLLEHEQH